MNQHHPFSSRKDISSQAIDILEQFIDTWQKRKYPPDISDFLRKTSDPDHRLLEELIKVDLEYRYSIFNYPKRLDDYQVEFPVLSNSILSTDLIYEEYFFRRQAGLQVSLSSYLKKYPRQAKELEQLANKIPTDGLEYFDTDGQLNHWETFKAGQHLDDFELIAELGKGSFAQVFKARQISMQRIVAIKLSANRGHEAQTLARLDHRNLVRIYDQRILPQHNLQLMYMEYIAGGTLKNVISLARITPATKLNSKIFFQSIQNALMLRGECLPNHPATISSWPETVCNVGAQLAAGLAAAHRQKILHLDIKPANVLLDAYGNPKLADFNISFKREIPSDPFEQKAGGSLIYMSPEQLRMAHPGYQQNIDSLDEKSDIYSLGMTLVELLTTRRLNRGKTKEQDFAQLVANLLNERMKTQRIETEFFCPPGLQQTLARCLHVEASERPDAEQLAQQLALCLKPEAYNLLHPQPSGIKPAISASILILFALIPNLLAAWFNYDYNSSEIIAHLPNESQSLFWTIQSAINSVAFPLGIGWFIWLAWPLFRLTEEEHPKTKSNGQYTSKRCVSLGHYGALINILLWSIAGIAYPLALHFSAGAMPLSDYPHFFISLFLCGLITSVYPFFLISAFCLRKFYPKMLAKACNREAEIRRINQVRQKANWYLGLGVLVPLFSILILILIDIQSRTSLVALCTASFLGLGLIIFLFQRLLGDLTNLRACIDTLFPER